ncbi:LOW QUALITY PROTEIN: hypothetical protein PHMEG_00025084, partial [Phytophthora megakarya]
AEDVVLGVTAEDIVVHANLRRDVLCKIFRRLLCLRSLDDVAWLRHVPEEYFDRAYKRAEETNWAIAPHEASEPSDGDDDVPSTPKKGRSKKRASGALLPRLLRAARGLSVRGPKGTPDAAHRMARLPEVSSDVSSDGLDSPVRRRRLSLHRNAAPDFCHTDTADAISWFVNGVQVHPVGQSGKHRIRGFPDYEVVPTSSAEAKGRLNIADYLDLVDGSGPGEDAPWDTMFRNREEVFWFACKEVSEECPSGFSDGFMILASEYVLLMIVHRRAQWERDHWVVFDRSSEAQKQVYLDRASRQRIALLSARERKWFRCEPGLWRRPSFPVAWVPLPRGDHTPSLRDQSRALDRRDPARVYWGLPGSTSRLPESVSPATWGTVVAAPHHRIFIPLPDDLPAEFVD